MTLRGVLGMLLLLLLVEPALAQTGPVLTQVRLGLPSRPGNNQGDRARRNAWAPVYVRVECTESITEGQYRLAFVARDTEQTLARSLVPIPALNARAVENLIGYVRPEGSARFEVQVLDANNIPVSKLGSPTGARELPAGGAILYATLGSELATLEPALRPEADKKNLAPEDEDRSLRQYAYLQDVRLDLPDRWLGYDAADIVILTTKNETFVKELLTDERRLDALAEWVARGGKLILSVARNHQQVRQLLSKKRLIDVDIKGKRPDTTLRQVHSWTGGKVAPTRIDLADIEVGSDASTLIRETFEEGPPGDRNEMPILVQGSYGLGRVVLVGFDLDDPQFANWSGINLFWRKLDALVAPKVPGEEVRPGQLNPGFEQSPGQIGRGPGGLQGELRRQLENFAEVPIISFGWVALLILFYILLVGPIDYFILKRWFKRLELTWITFPTIVVLVSVLAYLGACYAKGDSLRINKIDLVDIDLHPQEPQVYGTSWFGLFSPRIQNYTLGIEPSPDWVDLGNGASDPRRQTTLCVLAAPEQATRIGSQGLFPQPYDYAPGETGLERVPIPVWSSRAFEARWHAPVNRNSPPILADLKASLIQKGSVRGRLENNLEAPLEGVVLFHEGYVYRVGNLAPHHSLPIELLLDERRSQRRAAWSNDEYLRPDSPGGGAGVTAQIIKGMLFPGLTTEGINGGLRGYDQTWRVDPQLELPARRGQEANYRAEVVLVGRIAAQPGPGRTVNTAPGTPSRVWLDRLPSANETLPELQGTLNQETYLRVYIPVRRN